MRAAAWCAARRSPTHVPGSVRRPTNNSGIDCATERKLYREEPDLRRRLQRQRRLTAHTVYECPSCTERFVGERRCPSCQLFTRAVGLGGHCPECEQPVLLSDLLAEEL